MKNLIKSIMHLFASFVILMTLSCVPTPDEEIIIRKNSNNLVEQAVTAEESSEDASLRQRLQVPETYRTELKSTGGFLSVSVDATVFCPLGECPLLRIEPTVISQKDAQCFADALFGKNPHYISNAEQLTQGYYLKKLEILMDAIEHWDTWGANLFDLVYETKPDAIQGLDKLSKQAASAPETLPAYHPDFSLLPSSALTTDYEEKTEDSRLLLFAINDQDVVSRMDINNLRSFDGTVDLIYWRDMDQSNSNIFPNLMYVSNALSTTEEDAVEYAEKTIHALGLSDFRCTMHYGMNADPFSTTEHPVYMCIFTRCIQEVPVTYANNGSAISAYSQAWQQERIFVEVDDKGVLLLKYEGPFSIKEVLTERCALLPFSKIIKIFERSIVVVNNDVDFSHEKNFSQRYIITSIRLGLVAIRETGEKTGLLVPAWDFLGYEELTSAAGKLTSIRADECQSFLTINAIDGSIINRREGY